LASALALGILKRGIQRVQFDLALAVAGLLVGFLVGLTGMGGGALMTPILIVLFRVQPLAAVSSDLVASLFMKPIGAAVHYRRGTVERQMLLWLTLGSVPSAFAGVFVLRWLGGSQDIQQVVQVALGAALLCAAAAMLAREALSIRNSGRRTPAGASRLRPLATVVVGAVAGLVVGMTSAGSGSLVIVALMFLYPWLPTKRLVGTNITQAIPLVGSAALAHLLYGDFHLSITLPILVGAIPGVYIGARVSSQAPSRLLNPVLALVLLASGLKLMGVGVVEIGVLMAIVAVAGASGWAIVHRRRSSRGGSRVALSEPT
jgi:uncharacterized membrane protein YfcA